ncbi:TonB-dependent receptor [Balneola sp. MJW-20]|uniref:TonB-dependent receptor n=1 Tax=Gracilimonas aurantiaca TaxID=3234185 RepID=UPI003464E94C
MHLLFTLIISLITVQPPFSDGFYISGKVTEPNGEAVQGALVGVAELNKAAYTDSTGFFILKDLPAKQIRLRISMVGYKSEELRIDLSDGSLNDIEITVTPLLHELDQVVVTGTLTETTIADSPVKVNRISVDVLKKSTSQNIMDAAKYINGLYTQVDCSVCGTSNIRINGMEGPYTSVLIDGMPVMGALASVYSLEGIQPDVIQNLEIIKGPNSTLYGSQAMGGVINILTSDPATSPALRVEYRGSTHSQHTLNAKTSFKATERIHSLLGASYYRSNTFIDENEDGFSDITLDRRFTLFNKWTYDRPDFQKASFALKYYNEERLGGTRAYNHSLRGSDTIYGESIYTNRLDLMGTYDLPVQADVRLDASYSYHDQDSYYGDYRYEASQVTQFANLIWTSKLSSKDTFLSGLTYRYDILDQLFDGEELPGGSRDHRFVPGMLIQIDREWSDSFRSLAGFRVDHQEDHGLIYSPRLSFKYKPSSHSTFRFNAGTGFRIVNLFTEEHEALTGSRRVQINEELDPERSVNLTTNWNQIIDIGPSILNADIDFFYTRFSNQIIPDYTDPALIQYSNLEGYSVSRGVSVNLAHNFVIPLTYMIGFTLQDVFQDTRDGRSPVIFAPDYTAVFNLSYTIRSASLTLDYTGRLNGPMKLPEYQGFSDISPVYTEQNIKISRSFANGLNLYASVNNLFNYTQPNPILSADQPFSEDFATDYVYGPIQGRRVMAGISFTID